MEPGTWTELLVGVGSVAVALALGTIAVRQAGKATKHAAEAAAWAEIAAKAQQHANALAEAALPVSFSARIDVTYLPDWAGSYDAILVLTLDHGSAAVTLHRLVTKLAWFGDERPSFGQMYMQREIEQGSDELPHQLHAGEWVSFPVPWTSFVPEPGKRAFAIVTAHYRATAASPTRSVDVDVTMPEPPPPTPTISVI